jgi:hypothetical protein
MKITPIIIMATRIEKTKVGRLIERLAKFITDSVY